MLTFLALALCLPASWAGAESFDPLQIRPTPPAKAYGAFFEVRPETSDAEIDRGLTPELAVGVHGIRNHWPREVELHYGLGQATARLANMRTEDSRLSVWATAGLGLANKLASVNRIAYLAGVESDFETASLYANVRGQTIGAPDFDQKYLVRMRLGFYPSPAGYDAVKFLVMMHVLLENHAEHTGDWGPVVRLQYRNMMTELYGTFKGAFSFAFGLYY